MEKVPSAVSTVGTFIKDKIDSEITKTVYDAFETTRKAKLVEMTNFLALASRVKLDCE